MKNIIFKLILSISLVLPILSYGQATRVTLSQLAQSGAFNNQSIRWDSLTSTWKPFTITASGGTVTSVGISLPSIFTVTVSPITSSGTLTATLANQNANLVFAGPSTGAAAAPTFRSLVAADIPALPYVPTSRTLTINGTALDLSANRSWSVGTVTSVAALTLGTTGTDVSSSVANGSTTPVITLNIPTASATNRGALSSTDWTTFNNKQSAITLTTTGNSGAATFTSNTLNIPNYTLTGLGGFANPMTTLGDMIYGGTSGTPTRLEGQTTGSTFFLSQTGTGTASNVPIWKAIAGADVTGAALTKTDDTNVTLTLGGVSSAALLRTVSLTLGWTGQLAIDRGGTGASTAPAARTNLGASTVGSNLFTVTNPSAETYLRVNADNSATLMSAASYRESLSLVSSGPNVIGHIVHYSSTTNIDTTGLFWNSTTGRLGIGTNTPSKLVDIQGDIAISGVAFGTGKNGVGNNIAIGLNSLVTNTTGFADVAIGKQALKDNTTGDYNTAIGENSLKTTTTGDYNLGIGADALSFNTTGSRNISIGAFSGNRGAEHTKSIFIGYDTKSESTLAQTNQIVIGDSLIGLGSNSVILGNYNITKTLLQGNVGIGTTAFSSKLDIKGSGNTASTSSLKISNSLDTTLLLVRNDAKVGIGTTNIDNSISGANLTIGSSSGGSVSLRSGTTLLGRLQANSTQVELYAPVGSAEVILTTNATPRFYVKSDGKVGIGTDTPKSTLQVNGSFGRTPPTIVTSSTAYTVDSQTNPDSWVIFTAASGTLTLTLPSASTWTGREITFRCSGDLVVNTNTDIYGPSYTLTTSFLTGILRTATLVSDGTYWVVVSTN